MKHRGLAKSDNSDTCSFIVWEGVASQHPPSTFSTLLAGVNTPDMSLLASSCSD